MPQYLCSLPNEKNAGRIPCLISDDPRAIAAFVKRWDVPGRGVYCCINPLRPSATRRTIDNVEAINRLAVDLDYKDLIATPEKIEQRLRGLPLQPTWIRRSGGGLHVGWELKEPVAADDAEGFRQVCDMHKRLVAALSGDPAVAHPAALLRVIGTHNSKRGEGVRVESVGGSGKSADLLSNCRRKAYSTARVAVTATTGIRPLAKACAPHRLRLRTSCGHGVQSRRRNRNPHNPATSYRRALAHRHSARGRGRRRARGDLQSGHRRPARRQVGLAAGGTRHPPHVLRLRQQGAGAFCRAARTAAGLI